MRKFSKKQYLVAGAAAVIVAAGTGAAYAYWTTSGTGTGSASTGTSSAVTVNQVSAPTDLAPGIAPETITFNVTNPSTTTTQRVSNVTISITVTPAAGAPAGGGTCDASDYDLTQPSWTPQELAAGVTSADNATATLGFHDKTGTNQDNCKGATVNLTYTAS